MKAASVVIGVALLALGLAGFVPGLNPDGQLFGVLPMNTMMSVLFAVTGVAGIAIGLSSRRTMVPPSSSGGNGQDMRPWV